MSGGGSGSSGPTQSTVTNTNLPDYLQPQAEQLAGQAQALTDTSKNPFQSYIGNSAAGGQGVQGTTQAGLTPLQQQAMSGIGQMGVAGQTGAATNMAGQAGQNAQNMLGANYGNQYDNTLQNFTGQNVSQYMSPYMQNVVQQQSNAAIKNYAQQLPGLASNITMNGGLGGSRAGLMQAQAQENLQNQLAGIQATGSQNAFQNAQNQFNTQNQMGMQNAQNTANFGQAANQLNVQNQQGANQQLLGASGQLGQLGQNQYGQQMGILNAQNQMGTQQQNLATTVNDLLNQNFQNKVNYPYAQQAFMSGILHGTSPGALGQQGSVSQYSQPANVLGQLGGIGTGLAGLYGASQSGGG